MQSVRTEELPSLNIEISLLAPSEPALPTEILDRQQAVEELSAMLDLRHELGPFDKSDSQKAPEALRLALVNQAFEKKQRGSLKPILPGRA